MVITMENQSHIGSAGLGVLGVLTIIFVVLKLLHIIEWSWLLVFSPALIGLALKIILIIGAVLMVMLGTRRGRKSKK